MGVVACQSGFYYWRQITVASREKKKGIAKCVVRRFLCFSTGTGVAEIPK
jgi:hypothetical protein